MIASLSGVLSRKSTQSVIIRAGGVGYEVFVPLSTYYTLPEINESVTLHIYTHVREDALLLFGFQTELEKKIFMMLISISGIGPKLAVNILSGIGPHDLMRAIAAGDSLRLRSIPGVGKKTAERIALELKDQASRALGDLEPSLPPEPKQRDRPLLDDALSALLNLGYSSKSARAAVEKAKSSAREVTLEGLIKEALRVLA